MAGGRIAGVSERRRRIYIPTIWSAGPEERGNLEAYIAGAREPTLFMMQCPLPQLRRSICLRSLLKTK
jgi:hypothetical protein